MSRLTQRNHSAANIQILEKWAQVLLARIDQLQEERDKLVETDSQCRSMDMEIKNFHTHYQHPLVLVRHMPNGERPAACSRVSLLDTVELYLRSGGTVDNLHPLSRVFSNHEEVDLTYVIADTA